VTVGSLRNCLIVSGLSGHAVAAGFLAVCVFTPHSMPPKVTDRLRYVPNMLPGMFEPHRAFEELPAGISVRMLHAIRHVAAVLGKTARPKPDWPQVRSGASGWMR
jgi:hypothetical protein